MKLLGILGGIAMAGWLGAVPAAARGCCRHYYGCDGCRDHCRRGYAAPPSTAGPAQAGAAVNPLTVEGRITEVIYLPGAAAGSGMVEIRVQAAGPAKLVRLAPAGVLKRGGLHLREGDTVTLSGLPVGAMEGDLVVASTVRQGDVNLALRDAQGRPAW